MANRFDLLKWTGSGWGVCRRSYWVFNATRVAQHIIYNDYGTYPDCGPGAYGTLSFTYISINGQWRGGALWSGYHYL